MNIESILGVIPVDKNKHYVRNGNSIKTTQPGEAEIVWAVDDMTFFLAGGGCTNTQPDGEVSIYLNRESALDNIEHTLKNSGFTPDKKSQ